MKKDDPKVAILLQQADLLCSLATKINHEDTSQSMDEAWQVFACAGAGGWGVGSTPTCCCDFIGT